MVPDTHHICKKFIQKYYNKKSQTLFVMVKDEAPVISHNLFHNSIRDSINKEATH